MIAKWIIRNLAYEEGLDVTFAPKITTGKAGSGLHVHMRITRDGENLMLDDSGKLSNDARRMIAGLVDLAPALTAFGNKNPTSYFRLVPHQEAPTNVCWGDRNRSVLVRVPLGWTGDVDMCREANPLEPASQRNTRGKQTVEIRNADGSADVYQTTGRHLCSGFVTDLKCPMRSKWRATRMSMSIFMPPIRQNWSSA